MEIIAHRGSCYDAPENTLEAFDLAISEGAERIELDVRTSSDDVVFVTHDETTAREGDRDLLIAAHPGTTLDGVRLANGEALPRFRAVCEHLGGRTELNVELKSLTPASARTLLRDMNAAGLLDNALITSRYTNALHLIRDAGYTGRLGLIVGSASTSIRERIYEAWPFRAWQEVHATELIIHHLLYHPLMRMYVRRHGGRLALWMSMDDERRSAAVRQLYYRRIAFIRPDMAIVGRVYEAKQAFSKSK